MRMTTSLLCLAVSGGLLLSAALADTLITKRGSKYEGTVTESGDSYILTKATGGRMAFPKRMVREVIKDTPAAPKTKPAPIKPPDLPKPTTKPKIAPPKPEPAPGKPKTPASAPAKEPRKPGEKRTVFAAPFENVTAQDQYDPAAAGLGDMVLVLLAQQKDITSVERQRLAALTAEQARSLKGLTGSGYAIQAGRLLKADTVLTGRLYLAEGKLTVSVKAIDIASERVVAADQMSCRPTYLMEAALQLARKLGEHMKLPLPQIDLKEIDKSPIASLHFAKGLSHYYAGNMDAAIMQFMRTMDIDPNYYEAHYFAGMCYHRLGEDAHSIIEWEKFLAVQPKSRYDKHVRKLLGEAKSREKKSTIQRLGPTTAPAAGGKKGQ